MRNRFRTILNFDGESAARPRDRAKPLKTRSLYPARRSSYSDAGEELRERIRVNRSVENFKAPHFPNGLEPIRRYYCVMPDDVIARERRLIEEIEQKLPEFVQACKAQDA